MKIFISWSGQRSKEVARSLHEWLPTVIQTIEPWMSEQDISAGQRWSDEIGSQLAQSKFGIICVTPENQSAPWLNFEAGAIAKTLEESRVIPLLFDMELSGLLPGPLTQYQAVRVDKQGIFKLLASTNQTSDRPLTPDRLNRVFDGLWQQLESKLLNIPPLKKEEKIPQRQTDEKIDELLELVRDISRADVLQQGFASVVTTLALNPSSKDISADWNGIKNYLMVH